MSSLDATRPVEIASNKLHTSYITFLSFVSITSVCRPVVVYINCGEFAGKTVTQACDFGDSLVPVCSQP